MSFSVYQCVLKKKKKCWNHCYGFLMLPTHSKSYILKIKPVITISFNITRLYVSTCQYCTVNYRWNFIVIRLCGVIIWLYLKTESSLRPEVDLIFQGVRQKTRFIQLVAFLMSCKLKYIWCIRIKHNTY